jgi:hypothetical protein
MLSALATIMRMAHGDNVPALTKDSTLAKTVIALGAQLKPKVPRYTKAVDLEPLWNLLIKEREKAQNWKPRSCGKLRMLRDHALLLGRHDQMSRSDCQAKIDYRSAQYCRVFNSEGVLVTEGTLAARFMAAIPDGYVEVQYLNPKDPRKKGLWSDVVTVQPLQVDLLVDPKVPHLATTEKVEYLCWVRTMVEFINVAESQGRWKKVRPGGFWFSHTHYEVVGGNHLLLSAERIGKIVKDYAAKAGIGAVSHKDEGHDTEATLAGHFLRGHAASIAYTLAVLHGASWDAMLGVDRARHTLQSFFKSYARGTVVRLTSAFSKHKFKKNLRFESAARL